MPDDLRQEVMKRLRDAGTRQRIADALIAEATGGPPDPKSGVPKGGATVIRAFELIRDMARERVPAPNAPDCDFSRYTDAELTAMLNGLESAAALTGPDNAVTPGDWASGIPPPDAGSRRAVPPNRRKPRALPQSAKRGKAQGVSGRNCCGANWPAAITAGFSV